MVPGPGEDEGGNRGGARVRMRDFATAREAAKVCAGSPRCFDALFPFPSHGELLSLES